MITIAVIYAISVGLLLVIILRAPVREDIPDSEWEDELAENLSQHARLDLQPDRLPRRPASMVYNQKSISGSKKKLSDRHVS